MRHGTKADAIRGCLAANPGASAKAVVDTLEEQRVKVSLSQVYAIKAAKKTKAKPKINGMESLLHAKKLVEVMGGVDEAKAAVAMLEKLIS